MPLSDREIRQYVAKHKMITPFESSQIRFKKGEKGVLSYGTSSYGYDIRLGENFWLFQAISNLPKIVDPKAFNQACLCKTKPLSDNSFILPPHSFALAHSLETFNLPRDILTFV